MHEQKYKLKGFKFAGETIHEDIEQILKTK